MDYGLFCCYIDDLLIRVLVSSGAVRPVIPVTERDIGCLNPFLISLHLNFISHRSWTINRKQGVIVRLNDA